VTRLTDEELARLDELEKAATAGEWKPKAERYPNYRELWHAFDPVLARGGLDLYWLEVAGEKFPAVTGNGPTSEANAALIAAARNALPSLLAELRQLREVAELVSKGRCCEGYCDGFVQTDEMRDALAAYYAPTDKEPAR
jgi:hypothetical protein